MRKSIAAILYSSQTTYSYKHSIAFLLVFLIYLTTWAQSDSLAIAAQKPENKEKNRRFLVLPLITYSPETSLRIGVVGIYYFRGDNAEPGTQLSTIKVPLTYTLNNQMKARMSYEIFSNQNTDIFKGHLEWLRFPLFFYGIGNDTQAEDEELFTTQGFSFEVGYLKRIGKNTFIGGRYTFHNSQIIEKEPGGALSVERLIPGSDGGITSGLGLTFRFDKRDNNFNATTGSYVESRLTGYPDLLGSDFEYVKFDIDLRGFWRPFRKHVLAAQLFIENNWGKPSFENMALLGGDEMMRGHYLGRFRDNSYIAAQIEYRLPIGRSQWNDPREKIPFLERWGLVGFAGLGRVADTFTELGFNDLKKSLGVGIRYLAIPKERINIRLDFGFGTQQPGFYFNIREAF